MDVENVGSISGNSSGFGAFDSNVFFLSSKSGKSVDLVWSWFSGRLKIVAGSFPCLTLA